MIPYLVSKFAKSTLSNLVKESFGSDFPEIFGKLQVDYIFRYLRDLGAESILLEFEYVDKDFLEDYSRYYVKRFSSDGKHCARLHFFSTEVTHGTVEKALQYGAIESSRSELQKSYLGFIVVKPLPKTFIGKTCLKQYSSFNNSSSKQCIARRYDVDLFGIKLSVDSVAFQEQDKEVSACAATAIWSTLHAMKSRSVRDIPACSEITINALNHIDGSSNHFPSKELSNKQILRALDVERLRNHLLKLNQFTQQRFVQCVKYHVDSGIPMILGADVYEIVGSELKLCAGHAVAIVGYKGGQGSDISALYIHDDRLGPFARATFVDLSTRDVASGPEPMWGLELQCKDDDANWQTAHEILVPTSLTIPTNKKIRLSFEYADATCQFVMKEYDAWCADVKKVKSLSGLLPRVDFRLTLREISDIRQEVIDYDFESKGKEKDPANIARLKQKKVAFLVGSYARFQWEAEFKLDGDPAFRIYFDATDIPQGKGVSAILELNATNAELLLGLLRGLTTIPMQSRGGGNFCMALLHHLREPDEDREQHLNKTYGSLRAPSYLKEREVEGGNVARNSDCKKYRSACPNTLDEEMRHMLKKDEAGAHLIWAIAHDGALLIGLDLEGIGHPSLTGFKPARIAGELSWGSGIWRINARSGRYSKDYPDSQLFLENALEKFRTIFYRSRYLIECQKN